MTEVTTKIKKASLKRFFALVLTACMCFTMMPVDTYAKENAKKGQTLSTATSGEATGGEATGGEATGGEATGGEATGGETPDVAVENVTLNKTTLDLKKGESATLIATVVPKEATNKEVTWTSSDKVVATVDDDGKVTAVAVGTANITVTTNDGGFTAVCAVTVKEKEPEKPAVVGVIGVSVTPTKAELKVGETTTLKETVAPADATEKAVTWTSSNTKIATVNNGTVTAVAAGTANITVTTKDGGFTAVCAVTVKEKTQKPEEKPDQKPEQKPEEKPDQKPEQKPEEKPDQKPEQKPEEKPDQKPEQKPEEKPAKVSVTKIALDKKTATVAKGKSVTLKATVSPKNATDKKVTWTSSNTKIATVKNGKVSAKKAGEVTITAKAGKKTATCVVTVSEVTLNAKTMPLQKGKSTTALKATVSTKKDAVKSWTSSDKKVATVDKNGKITAKKAGKATITVTTKKGATASCVVTVQKNAIKLKKLSFKTKTENVQVKKTLQLEVNKDPISAVEKVTWTSSNKKVATVDKNGKVKGLKKGTVTITAKAGSKKATIKVNVKNPSVTLKKTSATIKVGKTTKIEVKKSFPENDTVRSYQSSNKKIATVDKNGKVKGVKKGSATITVTMKSGAKAKFKVTVKK